MQMGIYKSQAESSLVLQKKPSFSYLSLRWGGCSIVCLDLAYEGYDEMRRKHFLADIICYDHIRFMKGWLEYRMFRRDSYLSLVTIHSGIQELLP